MHNLHDLARAIDDERLRAASLRSRHASNDHRPARGRLRRHRSGGNER